MKTVRVLSRLAILSLAAAAFTLLTLLCSRFVHTPSPTPHWKLHRSLGPKISELPELFGEGIVIAVCTVAGRLVFRLRLTPPSPTAGQLISLSLRPKAPTNNLSYASDRNPN
jgi:hypothetical protein